MIPEVDRRRFLAATGTTAAAGLGAAGLGAAAMAQDESAAPKAAMKILAISTSPRKGKTTATALGVCLDAVRQVAPAIETELVELAGMRIPGEPAAGIELDPGERDDFPKLVPLLTDPNTAGIIIGTPVYFGNMSFLCKAMLDRWILFRKDNFALRGKVGGVLAVGGGRNAGVELTIRCVQTALMAQQLIVVGDAPPTGHWGGTVWAGAGEKVTDDKSGMETVVNLGRAVAEMALKLRGAAA